MIRLLISQFYWGKWSG